MRRIDLTGMVFGRLTVLEYVGPAQGGALWRCQCKCGNVSSASGSNLRSGGTSSCGCILAEKRAVNPSNGHRNTPVWKCWSNMVNRCHNQRSTYYHCYGGRGISVCARWRVFLNFLEDMGPPPPGLSLDRIDTNGNYEPGNCRWATTDEQNFNKRNTVRVDVDGTRYTIKELAAMSGMNMSALYKRRTKGQELTKGWR